MYFNYIPWIRSDTTRDSHALFNTFIRQMFVKILKNDFFDVKYFNGDGGTLAYLQALCFSSGKYWRTNTGWANKKQANFKLPPFQNSFSAFPLYQMKVIGQVVRKICRF